MHSDAKSKQKANRKLWEDFHNCMYNQAPRRPGVTKRHGTSENGNFDCGSWTIEYQWDNARETLTIHLRSLEDAGEGRTPYLIAIPVPSGSMVKPMIWKIKEGEAPGTFGMQYSSEDLVRFCLDKLNSAHQKGVRS